MSKPRRQHNFRTTPEDEAILEALQQRLGTSFGATVRLALRLLYNQSWLPLPVGPLRSPDAEVAPAQTTSATPPLLDKIPPLL